MSFVVSPNLGKYGHRIITSLFICSIVHKILDIDIKMFYLFKKLETHLCMPVKWTMIHII